MSKVVDFDQLFPGRFLKHGEFLGKDVTITIADVTVEELPSEAGKAGARKVEIRDEDGEVSGEKWVQDRGVISFKETPKQLVLCKTVGEAMKAMWGRKVGEWIGRKITFYPDPSVRFGKQAVGGIRVRGAPDLERPITFELRLPKKRPQTVRLIPTGKRPPDAKPATAPAPTPATDLDADRIPGADDDAA